MTESPDIERWRSIQRKLCWTSATLAPALAGLRLFGTDRLPTAAVDARGRVAINPGWSASLSDAEAGFVILHECLHLVLRHHDRVDGRDRFRWNLAGDFVINDAIVRMMTRAGWSSVARPGAGAFRDVMAPEMPDDLSVEEAYEWLTGYTRGGGHVTGDGTALNGCGVDDADIPDQEPSGMSPAEWRNVAQVVKHMAKTANTADGQALLPLLEIPSSRVRWGALLRQLAATAVSRAGRDTTTWSHRGRRSPRRVILPGTHTNAVRLAVVIDSSGSMSDAELAACVAETNAAVTAAGISAYLVVHDAIVRTKTWITPGCGTRRVNEAIAGRGGTLFAPAYAAVEAEDAVFAAVVHFTDGQPADRWPLKPANCSTAICALTPDGRPQDVPSGWRVVPIGVPGR